MPGRTQITLTLNGQVKREIANVNFVVLMPGPEHPDRAQYRSSGMLMELSAVLDLLDEIRMEHVSARSALQELTAQLDELERFEGETRMS